ncbi:MAG: pyridoxamine 5'-phosphate oxidase [Xanthomonadales bacterium]|nr:pyridoxamine 5'-phosphate oxidase [Gammaproteobacteria bacterium]MBT8055128.1 pyridoxamine 5'-phosphate oxidase [Gammaproteobacteria bacterium]NND58383.1 pyridoxamine 5'-phosphate oxidase [Xanthomonadales bacterium]NNK51722.1 pyridoxamine 5'-phosphate oxidase [Xanthomonadales bacterium]
MSLSGEIIDEFNKAFKKARVSGEPEPTAMVLATSDGSGNVSSRTVLLKALDEDGFVFFTNINSCKGQQLTACPRASATFLWKASGVQVQLAGPVRRVSEEAADAYFATRDRGSQIGAWASRQSEPLDSRETLMRRVEELEQQYEGAEVPRPPFWTGFVLSPETVEFWTQREFRLHDRFLYTLENGSWSRLRLNP